MNSSRASAIASPDGKSIVTWLISSAERDTGLGTAAMGFLRYLAASYSFKEAKSKVAAFFKIFYFEFLSKGFLTVEAVVLVKSYYLEIK